MGKQNDKNCVQPLSSKSSKMDKKNNASNTKGNTKGNSKGIVKGNSTTPNNVSLSDSLNNLSPPPDVLTTIVESCSRLEKELKSTKKKINNLDKKYKDVAMKHDEMLEQIDYLTESIDIEMEEGEEEIVSNIQQLLVQGNIKSIISPQQVMNDLLLEKNYKKRRFNQEQKLCEQYLESTAIKTPPIADLQYFIDLPLDEKKVIIDKEKELLLLQENKIPARFQILNSSLPSKIKQTIIDKINSSTNMMSSDSTKLTNWVNGLLEIKWDTYASLPVNFNSKPSDISNFLENTYYQLDNVVYGQEKTKEHIIQILAKMITNPSGIGNVFSIYGPMGTGKTTIIKEGMAKALGIPFVFISLGGNSDSSFLDGHSYTYEGSVPGRIVEALKTCGCMNPIFYFDELDKVSNTNKGQEIINLLIHLTDPIQNTNFTDKYYSGIPFDLSKSLFVFSFNDITRVNPILRDRMNLINVEGFDKTDKLEICSNFVLPELSQEYKVTYQYLEEGKNRDNSKNKDKNSKKDSNKKSEKNSKVESKVDSKIDKINNKLETKIYDPLDFIITDKLINYIIENHTHNEAGVRTIKRQLETIISKINVIKLLLKGRVNNKDSNKDSNKNLKEIKNDDKKRKREKTDDDGAENYNIKLLDYLDLKNLSFPLQLDEKLVDLLIKDTKFKIKDTFQSHMYL